MMLKKLFPAIFLSMTRDFRRQVQ